MDIEDEEKKEDTKLDSNDSKPKTNDDEKKKVREKGKLLIHRQLVHTNLI